MSQTLLLLPGDGIGPEVTAQARRVAEVLAPDLAFDEDLVGGASIDAHGEPLTVDALVKAKSSDAVLLGAVGGPQWAGVERHLRPEIPLNIRKRDVAILDHVVEQRCGDGHRVKFEVRQDRGDRQGMGEIRITGLPRLAPMGFHREDIGPVEEILISFGVVLADAIDQFELTDYLRRVAYRWRREIRRCRTRKILKRCSSRFTCRNDLFRRARLTRDGSCALVRRRWRAERFFAGLLGVG